MESKSAFMRFLHEEKEKVLRANLLLHAEGLAPLTWGNVSERAYFEGKPYIFIKPSGIDYETMTACDIVVMDEDEAKIDGKLKPSTDLPTHLKIYKAYRNVFGVCHAHPEFAVAWAQAKRDIPNYGTTHSDFALGPIKCTRELKGDEIQSDYEANTGLAILEAAEESIPGINVCSHGPFTWGKSGLDAVKNMITLEKIAKMAYLTERLNSKVGQISNTDLAKKHYYRKHGKDAYYGQ